MFWSVTTHETSISKRLLEIKQIDGTTDKLITPSLVHFLGKQLDATLGLCWLDTLETARAGLEGIPHEDLPPLSRQQTELAMEILKILFNVTFDTTRRKVDEVLQTVTHGDF